MSAPTNLGDGSASSPAGAAFSGVADAHTVPRGVEVLEPFVRGGVFGPSEVHLAATFARLSPGLDDLVLLALAVAARGPRLGHVCIELADVARQVGDTDESAVALPWPDPIDWARALGASDAVADPSTYLEEPLRPLVWDGRRVYLQRYYHYETSVAASLQARAAHDPADPAAQFDVVQGALGASAGASSPLPVATSSVELTEGAENAPAGASGADSGSGTAPPPAHSGVLDQVLDQLFGADGASDGGSGEHGPDLQRHAATVALTHGLAVIVGGPGTGKTRTVARLLAAAHVRARAEGKVLQVALAAPTGKAASRMTEAVRKAVDELGGRSIEAPGDSEDAVSSEHSLSSEDPVADDAAISEDVAAMLRSTEATTLHRLLGWAPGTRFRHDRSNPLPHDLVVVDETSMVALPLMARLLDAVRPDARLVLVGDPFQLASVEAGTVLGDVVGPALELGELDEEGGAGSGGAGSAAALAGPLAGPLAGHVAVLRRARRFRADSAIAALGDAIRVGDADAALEVLDGSRPDATWVRDVDTVALAALERVLVDAGVDVVMSALAGLAPAGLDAASKVKVLAATRHRPLGLYDWSDRLEAAIAARVPELQRTRRWYVGRPVMVTANDPLTRVSNGDVGLVVARDDGPAVAFRVGDDVRFLPPSRLDRIETWWAMTIHKSQGSEFAHAVVSLPPSDSPILTRELLYTAVTRAKEQVTVVGSEASLRAAIERPIARASGLRERLWPTV